VDATIIQPFGGIVKRNNPIGCNFFMEVLPMGILSGLFRSRDKPQNILGGGRYNFFFGGTSSGKAVNEHTAMQMTAVYSCVRILSETLASLPLHVYRYNDSGGKEKYLKHPLYKLLHDEPNPEMTSFAFRETLMSHLLLWGNAYAQIIRNAKGEILALYPLMPNKMTVDRDSSGRLFYLYQRGSEDTPSLGKDSQVCLPPSDVLHIPGLGFDGLVGYSPIAMAKNSIGLAIATEEYGAKFFANGAAPGGVLEHPGTIKDPQKVKESWNAAYQGSQNSHRVAVLEEGMKYQPIGISPEQAQFLETRKFQINEIARIFRVPPHMVGDLEKSSFSNIEQQSLEFVKYTLDPWLIRWEQSLCRALLSSSEKPTVFIKFNVDGLLRGDYEGRMKGYSIGIQNGFMSPNDVRMLEDLDRIPSSEGGDLYLTNGSLCPLTMAGAAYIARGTTSNILTEGEKNDVKSSKTRGGNIRKADCS
jgi:HK97 family phage portal protein